MIDTLLMDNPLILSILFHPRSDKPRYLHAEGKIKDGTILVDEKANVVLGYRFYIHEPHKPVILYFHGNGELASDHDEIAPLYHQIGASLLVVDFRGYGWSTGKPLTSKLLSDMEGVYKGLPIILGNIASTPIYVMGRSLGSICAIHIAHLYSDFFKGLIIESGIGHVQPLLMRLGLPISLLGNFPDPIGNVSKVENLNLPLLIIHGERDSLLPVNNGQTLYDASPSEKKVIFRVPGAEHNNILYVGMKRYFEELQKFIS